MNLISQSYKTQTFGLYTPHCRNRTFLWLSHLSPPPCPPHTFKALRCRPAAQRAPKAAGALSASWFSSPSKQMYRHVFSALGAQAQMRIPADKASIFIVLSPPRSAPGTSARLGSLVDLQLSDIYGRQKGRHLAAVFLLGQKNLTAGGHVKLAVVVLFVCF